MSYFENINPKMAMETLGLRRSDPGVMEIAVPVLAAFGLGLGVGAGIALLLAPKPGRDLRQDISKKAVEMRDDLQEKASTLQENVKKAMPEVARVAESVGLGSTASSVQPGTPRSVTNG